MSESLKIIGDAINKERRILRGKILADLKKHPTPELSELLRKIDGDILFWESQKDFTVQGIVNTLNRSFKELE